MNTYAPLIKFFCATGKKRVERIFQCQFKSCASTFKRFIHWQKHGDHHKCSHCSKFYARLHNHKCNYEANVVGHGMEEADTLDTDLLNTHTLKQKSIHHAGSLLTLEYKYEILVDSFSDAIGHVYPDADRILTHLMNVYGTYKCSVYFDTILVNYDKQIKRNRTFYTPAMIYADRSNIASNFRNAVQYLVTGLEYSSNDSGSGWALDSILRCELRVSKYAPFKPKQFVPYPRSFAKNIRYCINVRANDNCFKYSVIAGLYEKQIIRYLFPSCKSYSDLTHSMRRRYKCYLENHRNYEKLVQQFDIKDTFSACHTLDDLSEFEVSNNCSILVLRYDANSRRFFVLKPTIRKRQHHVDLLLLTDSNKNTSHYVLIRDLRGLIGTSGSRTKDICRMCLKGIQVSMSVHLESCGVEGNQVYKFPNKPRYEFRKHYMHMPIAFMIFYKINMYLVAKESKVPKYVLKYSTYTANIQAASYCIVVVGPTREVVFDIYYDGENVMESFLDTILQLTNKYRTQVRNCSEPLVETPELMHELKSVRMCPICKDPFSRSPPVRHHSHSVPVCQLNDSNSYMANRIICNACNLRLIQKAVCCIGFNTNKVEHHFIVKSLKQSYISKVKLICKNAESILALVINNVNFIDLRMFLDFPFKDIVKRQMQSFTTIKKAFPRFTSNCLAQFLHVNCIPYKWMRDRSCLASNKLPEIDCFHDIYTGAEMTTEEYSAAEIAFAASEASDFRSFLRECTRSSVFLLSDIAINLSDFLQKEFSLFPFHCVTIHSYNFDAFVSSLHGNTWEMIPDAKTLRFIASAVHGGLLTSNIRLCVSNSEFASNFNGVSSARTHILNLDIASCYGAECLKPVGHKDMRFLTQSEVNTFNIGDVTSKEKGYLLRVFVSVPQEFHAEQSSLPLLYGKRRVVADELDESQRTLFHSLNSIFTETTREMLILDLTPKLVTVHSNTLRYWMERGVCLHRIEEILEFSETDFIAPYMCKVLRLRQEASLKCDDIMSLFLKTMANSLVGKLASNTQRMFNYVLSTSARHTLKLVKQGNFDSFYPISEDIVLFQMKRKTVTHTGCLLSAVCIYANSKLRVFTNFRELQLTFPKAEVIYCDTDGYMVNVPDPDNRIVEYFKANKTKYDFSKLDQSSVLYSTDNKNTPGIWRVVDTDILSSVCLRPKCYSFLRPCKCATGICECQHSENKNSGLRTEILTRPNYWYYLAVLLEEGVRYFVDERIVSNLHNVQLVTRRSIGFTTLNLSRYLLEDKINTRPFGFMQDSKL